MGRALIGCHWGTRCSGMGIPFGTEMPTAVCVPTSIPDFYSACSRKAQAPTMPMIRVNPSHAYPRNRGVFAEIACIEVGHFYPNWIGSYVSCQGTHIREKTAQVARYIRSIVRRS